MTTICIEIQTVLQPTQPGQGPKKVLVSLGMATSDGQRFYAVNADTPMDTCIAQLTPAIWKALPLLEDPIQMDRNDPDVLPLDDARAGFEAFVGQIDHPQFWSANGHSDYCDLRDVFGYSSELLLPAGFPRWVSSVREQRARVLDSIGHRDEERLQGLQATGMGDLWPGVRQRCAFKNAHSVLRILHATEELALENDVDTAVREPAWGDSRHVWAADTSVYLATRPSDTAAIGRMVGESVRRAHRSGGAA